jgi:hypothetical protein
LHVLGLPPAFVLSQDQTLKLNEFRFWSAWRNHSKDHCVTGTFTQSVLTWVAPGPAHHGDGLKRSSRQSLVQSPAALSDDRGPARAPPPAFPFLRFNLSKSGDGSSLLQRGWLVSETTRFFPAGPEQNPEAGRESSSPSWAARQRVPRNERSINSMPGRLSTPPPKKVRAPRLPRFGH